MLSRIRLGYEIVAIVVDVVKERVESPIWRTLSRVGSISCGPGANEVSETHAGQDNALCVWGCTV